MREVYYSSHFRKDFKLTVKRGLNMSLIRKVMEKLENEIPLDEKYKNHALTGSYVGNFECHIQPDWLLIYKIYGDDLYLVRTGTHSDLF